MERPEVVYCPGCGGALREYSEDTGPEGHFTRGSTLMVHLDGREEEEPPRPTYMGVCGGCGFAFDVLHRTTYAEYFEPAEFRYLEITIRYIAVIIQEDFDLAVPFETGDRINGNA